MKKIISMILSAVLLMGCLAMASGCKTKDKTVKDEKSDISMRKKYAKNMNR